MEPTKPRSDDGEPPESPPQNRTPVKPIENRHRSEQSEADASSSAQQWDHQENPNASGLEINSNSKSTQPKDNLVIPPQPTRGNASRSLVAHTKNSQLSLPASKTVRRSGSSNHDSSAKEQARQSEMVDFSPETPTHRTRPRTESPEGYSLQDLGKNSDDEENTLLENDVFSQPDYDIESSDSETRGVKGMGVRRKR